MFFYNPFRGLTRFEWCLWISSMIVVILCFFLGNAMGVLALIASLIGVTALIFTARGEVIGQILIVVFAILYGVISWQQRYYGEMLTYLGMSAPIAIAAVISWIRHPYHGGSHVEVEVNRLRGREIVFLCALTVAVTVGFYFILDALGTAQIIFSTLSVTTSFFAAYLTFRRSPYYAFAYAANDVVLIVLWVLASIRDVSCLSMVICFLMFLVNDLYGFFNWLRMQKRQEKQTRA